MKEKRMFFKSKWIQLGAAVVLCIVVFLLPRPEGTRFTIKGDNNQVFWQHIKDHFKRVNDTYGHLYGDEVLLHFSRLMEQNFRYKDIPFRFGGEEFVLLLETSGIDDVQPVLDRFRKVVESYDFPGVGKVTVSIGYTKCEQNTLPTTLIDHADKALYFAKENGRNRVVSYDELPEAESCAGDNNVDLF